MALTLDGTTGITASGNITGGNLITSGSLVVSGNTATTFSGNVNMSTKNIVNLADPVNAQDAATKYYVDTVSQGLHTHDSCNAATQTTLASISGGTVTYNNGTSGVGATLTTTGTYTTIDGVTLTNGMRILVKNEVTAANNGIYDRTSSTVLTRSDDFDTTAEMAGGDFTFVTAGTEYDNTGWVMTDVVTTVGTTPVNWAQFSGAGTYQAGTGLTLTGAVFSVNASQTQVTSVGTLGSLAVTGNISGGNLVGVANVNSTTFTGTTINVTGNANVGNLAATSIVGTVTTAAQTNITSLGTLTGLTVSGLIQPNANATIDLATTGARFNNVYGVTFIGISNQAKYADLAENYQADAEYAPGTVVSFGGSEEITQSNIDADTTVAGVVSENPAYLMNSHQEGTHVIALALQGRVLCNVTGFINKGDLLVSAGNGRARTANSPGVGTVIGKALQNHAGGDGVIEVVVGVR